MLPSIILRRAWLLHKSAAIYVTVDPHPMRLHACTARLTLVSTLAPTLQEHVHAHRDTIRSIAS